MDNPEEITTWIFRRMSPLALATSGVLHAGVGLALLPQLMPVHARLSERAIEVSIELPAAPPTEAAAPLASLAQQAAHRLEPGSGSPELAAPDRDELHAAAAPAPRPAEPDLAQILPSNEPPPPVEAREFATSAPPRGLDPDITTAIPPLEAPPPITGREFAMTAPSSLPKAPEQAQRPRSPTLRQPIQKAKPNRALEQQRAPDAVQGAGRPAASPVRGAALDDSSRQAQQDYLWQVIRKLSQYQFYSRSRERSEQGVVVTRMTIARDGQLIDVSLARSSGYPGLDQGVLETIRRASPFAPLPTEIAANSHTFIVPISYTHQQ